MISKVKTLLSALIHPTKFLEIFWRIRLVNNIPDEEYIRRIFRLKMGYDLDLSNPVTFNEKLQWLKLHDHNPLYTTLVDKYTAKGYVASHIGEEHIIPTLGVWDRFDDIDFDKLPDQFVLKCTHDSGGLVIVPDKGKLDMRKARAKINRSLKTNYYYMGREWPYKDVKPRVIAERFMQDDKSETLTDYKFMCFNGEMKCSFICTDRFTPQGLHVTFFDRDWHVMPFIRYYPKREDGYPKPKNYEKMVKIAEALSKSIPFVRIDLYEVQDQIYFGEYTFYPGNGYEEFTPVEWDRRIGDWITLPKEVTQ